MKPILLGAIFGLALLSTAVLSAQTASNNSPDVKKQPALVRLSGSLRLMGDFFQTTRQRQTTPDLKGRIHSDLALHLGKVQLQTNILYSSEQNRFQESLNQLGLRGRWRGLSFSVGDHYPMLSTFSLNGIKVQGASAQIDLGGLFISGSWGNNGIGKQKDLADLGKYVAYTQQIRAVRLGIGKPDGNHLHVVVFSANDDSTSITGRFQGVKPQQNISLSTSSAIKLFKGAVQLNGEATGTAFNPNQFGSKVEVSTFAQEQGVPEKVVSALTKFFSPTVGTELGYALKGDARIQLPVVGLNGSARYLAPGFTALGAPGMVSDVFDWSGGANIMLGKGKFIASGSYGLNRNNLSALLLSTIRREVLSANIQIQPIASVAIVGGYQRMVSTSQSDVQASYSQMFTSWNLSPTFSLTRPSGNLHSLSLNFILNDFGAPTLAQQGSSNFRNMGGMASVNSSLGKGLTLLASGTYMKDSSAFSDGITQGVQLGLNKPLMHKKLRISLLGSYDLSRFELSDATPSTETVRYAARLNTTWKITPKDVLQFGTTASLIQADPQVARIREMRGNAAYIRTF
ncbi:MAG: hypothetical protein J0L94_10485 [Rhodothermia bacterium]|nr:hypothetical protein [Rhodothermia bacterium]